MGLISLGIPNFVSGVSQQPPALKLPTASDSMDNCWPSVVSGISKRPPTEYVASLGTAFTSTAVGQIINRNADDKKFIISIADTNLRVFDFTGNEKTVYFPKGKAYLTSTDPASSFRFVNIQDTTFILNTEVPVASNHYGELSTKDFQPDGQVYRVIDLPDANGLTLGTTYYVTSTNTYYINTLQAATFDAFAWEQLTGEISSPTTGDTVVTSLPTATAAGTIVWLRTTYTSTTTTPVWNGSYWFPVTTTNTSYTYTQYRSYQTSFAAKAYNYWVSTTVASIVSTLNAARRDPTLMATVFITNAVANVYYNVYVNGVLKASWLSPNGTSASTVVPGTADIAANVKTALQASGYVVEQHGSTLTITNMNANDTITGTSSGGDKLIKCWRNSVPSFADLPPNSPEGRILKIAGDLESAQDDYYIVYSKGQWVETYGWNGGAGVYPNTMPWVLMHNLDDTFSFVPHIWRDRGCGDDVSCRSPSFTGSCINDMFLFGGRLGFISDTNLILSETFRYENFFRTTLASLQDSDPVDVTVATRNDDTLRHVIPFNKDLLLMADKSQYRLTYGQYIGPKNIQVVFTTAFNVSGKVKPANMGNSVYFVDDASSYRFGKLFEYFPRPNQQGDDADEITDPIPNYIPAGIKFLAGSPRMEMLLVGTQGDAGSLYVYKFFWASDKKIQNCWHRWTFTDADKVYWAAFIDNYLYVMIKRGTNVFIERIRTDEEPVVSATPRIMLDKLITLPAGDASMNFTNGFTTITLPWSYTTTPEVVGSGNSETGVRFGVIAVDSTHIKIAGDVRSYAMSIGIPYKMSFTLSSPYVRKQTTGGQVALLDGRLAVKYLHLSYSKTTYFKTKLTRKGYPNQYTDKFTTFDGNLIDNINVSLGTVPMIDGQLRVPIMSHNSDFTITIENDSPYNCSLQSGEWWASYHPRTKQFA